MIEPRVEQQLARDVRPAEVGQHRPPYEKIRADRGIGRRSAVGWWTWERPPDAVVGLGVPSQKEDVREQR